MNVSKWLLGPLMALSLGACGGGGGDDGGSNPTPVTPPSALSYPAPPTFTKSTAITALTPAVTGSVTAYSVAPALPAGLALNATTGVISGTPTAIQAATTHTITASNTGGSTTAGVSITVNDVVPSITYPRATYSFTTGTSIATVNPAVTGGTVVSWSIDHPLPAGLAFSTTTGVISGTPTATAAAATYVVSATNSGGSDTFDLSVNVQSGVLLELGHVASIRAISYAGSRVMSADDEGRTRLFDAQNGSIIVASEPSCDASCGDLSNLSGSTFVIRRLAGYDVYAAQSGALLSHIASPAVAGTKWRIATDGSYLVAWNATGLTAWTTAGAVLFTRPGNYASAGVFASPTEIRVGNGAAGAQVVENIAMPGGASTTTSGVIGTFHSWFGNGERFISKAAGNTIVVYSRAVVQEDTTTLPSVENLGGQGSWFWIFQANTLRIYAVGASSAPAATYTFSTLDAISPSANTIGVIKYGVPQISVIDLAGATPSKADYATRTSYNRSYAALSATDLVVGSTKGAIFGAIGTPQPVRYSFGQVRSIAGSATRTALTTASGETLYFNIATRSLEGIIDFSGSKVELSSNGSVLGVAANDTDAQYATDRTLRIYSLPSRNVLAEWPGTNANGTPQPFDFWLSAAGDIVGRLIGQNFGAGWDMTRQVIRYDNTVLWTDSASNEGFDLKLNLSPSGMLVGAPNQAVPTLNTGTNIYTNGALTGALGGMGIGWIDDGRLLLNTYAPNPSPNILDPLFAGAKIVSPTGQTLASPALPALRKFQRVDVNSIYSPDLNVILDVNSGNTVWSTNTARSLQLGAVAGNDVVFVSGSTVRAEPR